MRVSKECIFFLIFWVAFLTNGQVIKHSSASIDLSSSVFRDTVSCIAFDSISHNLGYIAPVNENNRVVKYFKYLGKEPVVITRAWSPDPHFICDYPREPLLFNHVYSFTTCFWYQGQRGSLSKSVGLDFSDGTKVTFKFNGVYRTNDTMSIPK
jgi:hypothetical protein